MAKIHEEGRSQLVGLSRASQTALAENDSIRDCFFDPYPPGIDAEWPSTIQCYFININSQPIAFEQRYLLPVVLACFHVHTDSRVISDDDICHVDSICREMQVPIKKLPEQTTDSILRYVHMESQASLSPDVNLVSNIFSPGSIDLEEQENNLQALFLEISDHLTTFPATEAVSAIIRFHLREIVILRLVSPGKDGISASGECGISSYKFHCVDPVPIQFSDGDVSMCRCTLTICIGMESLARHLGRVWKFRSTTETMVHLDVYSKSSLPRHGFGLFGDRNSEDLTIGDNNTFGLGIPTDQIIERNQLLFNQPSKTQVEPEWPWANIPASMQVCMKGVLSNIPRRSDSRNARNSWHRQGENNKLWHIANKLCSANQAACPCRLPSTTFCTRRNEGVAYCEFTGNPNENLLLEHLHMFENGRQFDSELSVCLLAYLFVQDNVDFQQTISTVDGFDANDYNDRFRMYCALTVIHNHPIPWSVWNRKQWREKRYDKWGGTTASWKI